MSGVSPMKGPAKGGTRMRSELSHKNSISIRHVGEVRRSSYQIKERRRLG